jgi:hypothetical protein
LAFSGCEIIDVDASEEKEGVFVVGGELVFGLE